MVERQRALVLALTAIVLAGCGPSERERRISRDFGAAGGTAAATVEKIDPATAGTIQGTVKFLGDPPPRDIIRMTADPKCNNGRTEEARREQVVVNQNGTLRDCLVYLELDKVYELPGTPVELDQRGCTYIPHVVGMQVNQPFNIKNSDDTLHNIHWIANPKLNGETNFGMPKPGVRTRAFEYPEIGIRVKCDVHPWMGAWLHVLTHPFHAVTGEDGSFTLEGVPPGTHKLVLWHEMEGFRSSQSVTVATGAAATAEFTVNG